MKFEEKLGEQYNKIANYVSDMIPGPWGESIYWLHIWKNMLVKCFLFTVPQKDELFYNIYQKILVSKKEYVNRAFRLCDLFDDLNAIFVKYGQEQFGTCEFDFTIEGNLNVSLST